MEHSTDLIEKRRAPASAQPGPGSTEPDEPRHNLEFDLFGAVMLSLLLGVWLIVSPLVLGYQQHDSDWVPVVAGALIALAAVLRATGMRSVALSFFQMAVATGLFLSAFWLADSNIAKWNTWGAATIAFFLAVVSAEAMAESRQTHGRGPNY